MPLAFIVAATIVVGAIVALALESWWVLPGVVLILLLATAFVIYVLFRTVGESEKPDPAIVADLEAAGVADPEGKFDATVRDLRARRRRRS